MINTQIPIPNYIYIKLDGYGYVASILIFFNIVKILTLKKKTN